MPPRTAAVTVAALATTPATAALATTATVTVVPTAPAPPRLHLVGDPGPDGGDVVPALRLRPLPQPQPRPWRPRPAPTGGTGTQQTFHLHGLATVTPEPGFADPRPTATEDLPCPEELARRLVQAVVDVVRGHRPATQVLRWTTPEVYSQLRQRARAEQALGRTGGRRPVVRSLRTHPCGTHGVEVSAVVLDGGRARAVAARLDGEDSRWRLTALVIG